MVKKTIRKKKTNETIKQQLLSSLKQNDEIEDPGLDETGNKTNDPLKAVAITNRYTDISKTQNKRAIGYKGKQGQPIKKFRDTVQFLEIVGQSKSTIHFKMGLHKFLKKYLKKSTLSTNYFKNNFKEVIKTICKNNVKLFSQTISITTLRITTVFAAVRIFLLL